MSDDVEVRIGLPLPLDVVTTIVRAISVVYPSARLDTSGGVGYLHAVGDSMRLVIDGADRYRTAADRDRILAAKRVVQDEFEPTLAAYRDMVSIATPEDIKYRIGYLASRFFADNPTAVNYVEVEMDVRNRDTGEAFVLTVRRSNGKTPHTLRAEAEAEVERLRARVAELEALR